MRHIARILDIKQVTHDVKCFRLEKPPGYIFTPGQATDVSININVFAGKKRPFTFTNLAEDSYLELTIKRYADHHGVTNKLHELIPGDELIIEDAWGAIKFKGPGYFIAGGAGITPFIAILRMLREQQAIAGNMLFFSNKTAADIIYEQELSAMLGKQALYILSRENNAGYLTGKINEAFIEQYVTDFSKQFYVCGPESMVKDITAMLEKLGAKADSVLFEK